jgi:hypothetical protein
MSEANPEPAANSVDSAPWRLGSASLTDDDFVEAMEDGSLQEDGFHHADHIRLAWILLRRESAPLATARMGRALRTFLAGLGTMTLLWMRLVAHHAMLTPATDFADFATANPGLFDKTLPFRFFSKERLYGAEARAGWLEPDLAALPDQAAR